MDAAPVGAMLVLLARGVTGSGFVVGFLVLNGVQCALWAGLWWLAASWLSRWPPLALGAALLVLAGAFMPIYGTAGHGSAQFGPALAKYRDAIRWSR